ncbi:MAG: hypothetical protein C5B50_19520 [Verrucomicrobia bacterium]|nr:MAG: hypothetical protein C5B50_19520 [Verrucomicrobiota bacterium]
MSSHPTYSEAKEVADGLVKDLAKGNVAAALSASQARDALAAYERLEAYRQATGRKLSLLSTVSQFCESAVKLNGYSMAEATDGFLTSIVTVKRIPLNEAIEQFIAFRKTKTVAGEGRRPQLSFDHWRNTGYWLNEFAETFPGYAVSELTKQLLDTYMAKFAEAAPKTRNERRGVVKMFLSWAVEQDYLAPTHRLLESSQLKHENADVETIECYTAAELRLLLERAGQPPAPVVKKGEKPQADYRDLLPVLALAGLAGMRETEILRLEWPDVFRVPGHIEVGALKAKTRSRRLIEVCTSLVKWLETYRKSTGPVWTQGYKKFHEKFAALRAELNIKHRRNGLRHSYISSHYAVHADEGLTAKLAGNSPLMVHKNYKGLLTRKQGKAWFEVAPTQGTNVIPLRAASEETR